MATGTLPDKDEDKGISSNESDELFDRVYGNDVAKGLGKAERSANSKPSDENEDEKSLREKETEGDAVASGWANRVSGAKKKSKVKGTAKVARKYWPLLAGGGGLGLVAAIFFALLPLKMEMFIQNITQLASEVPGYAVERRTEYVATRLLATHLLKSASGISGTEADIQSKLVFCKNASISCSLVTTYGANYFDNIIDISVNERTGGNVRMTITPKGQTQLGGNARSWEVTIEEGLNEGSLNRTTTQVLASNAEAKALVKNLVKDNMKTKSIATRFLARQILMKKYGITQWRAFEKTSNNMDEARTKIKASVLANTVGKVSKKMSLYLGCFSDASVCESLRSGISASAIDIQGQIDALDQDAPDYEASKKRLTEQKNSLDKLSGSQPLSDEDLAGGTAKDIILKRLLAVAGAAGIISTIDLVFGAVEAVDKGALEQVTADMAKVSYIGLAYGDETGLIPNNDKLKAGDSDLEVIGELTSLLDGAEQSPLMQYENGLISTDDLSANSYTRTCNVNDVQEQTTLAAGQLVCPERMVAKDYTSLLTTNPAWASLASVASVWNATIGQGIAWLGDIVGNAPIIKQVSDWIGSVAQPAIEWAMSLFLVPPTVGYETDGQNNYDALSGAIRVSQNELMEEGVDTDGSAYGAGGRLLSSEEVAAISEVEQTNNQEDFANQSLIAQIFNPNFTGSFAQQFVLRLPTDVSSVLSLPVTSLGQALNTSSASAQSARASVNPFGLPIYGYAVNDGALETDPSIYTEQYCSETAAAREASYGRDESRFAALPTYGVSDPCALEKMVVGSMLQAQGVTDDPYSLKEPGATPEAAAPATSTNTGRPDNVIDRGSGWSLKPGADYSSTPCDPRTEDRGVVSIRSGIKIRVCNINDPVKYPTNQSQTTVSSLISTNLVNMLEAAHAAGVTMGVSSGYRGGDSTQHGLGVAVDLGAPRGGATICWHGGGNKALFDACANGTVSNKQHTAAYAWLKENAGSYGFYNLLAPLWESWHWATS